MSELRKVKQEDNCKFRASLGYIANTRLYCDSRKQTSQNDGIGLETMVMCGWIYMIPFPGMGFII